MSTNGTARQALHDEIGYLQTRLDVLDSERAQIVAEIVRFENALSALDGVARPAKSHGAQTRRVIVAALASFDVPVSTTTLLAHRDLVHYTPETLRSTISDMHKRGAIVGVERTSHGWLWEPIKTRERDTDEQR